ncbi:fibronectin type III domain-containing protein [Spirillospora sp. CA-294931]|uniref:fibronectin type III domain-containing protein n=1 Tax=Spirillospora sp. CA-294931 TaxID=3240042 RepID=UPI003D8CB4DC
MPVRVGGVTTAALTGLLSVVPIPGGAALAETTKTLTYTCAFPHIGDRKVRVEHESGFPAHIPVQQEMPASAFTTRVRLDAGLVDELVRNDELTLSAPTTSWTVRITDPQGTEELPAERGSARDTAAWLTELGEQTAVSSLRTQGPIFGKPGEARVTTGPLRLSMMTSRWVPVPPSGLPGIVMESADCAPDPGQDLTLAVIQITDVDGKDTTPPTRPGPPLVTERTATSLYLRWARSTDPETPVAKYRVFYKPAASDAEPHSLVVTGTAARLLGLKPDTEHLVWVVATDGHGLRSEPGARLRTRTAPESPLSIANPLTGSTTIGGGAPIELTGTLKLAANASTANRFSGDLKLDPATGRFTFAGFVPVTADLTFTPAEKTTASLAGRTLSTSSAMTIGLTSIKAFGIDMDAGTECRTASPARLDLSGPTRTQTRDGLTADVSGRYVLPGFENCGPFTRFLNLFLAGPDNSLTLRLG